MFPAVLFIKSKNFESMQQSQNGSMYYTLCQIAI